MSWSDEKINNLNKYQKSGMYHPYTCGGPLFADGFCERRSQNGEGILIPTKDGFICPCGKYTQDWVHDNTDKIK